MGEDSSRRNTPKAKTQLRTGPEMKIRQTQHSDVVSDVLRHQLFRGTSQPFLVRRQSILCVDDEIASTRLRGEVLEEHGYSVTIYHRPLAVLSCDLSNFDLAILDFQMPDLNGRELLLRMRALGARFPIVLLTGSVHALSHEDRVLFARCIDKAEHINSLLETVAEFLDPNQIPDFGA
jgi:CheY-like chemotaxis protein